MSEDRYLINSVLRAAQILKSFSVTKPYYTNSELAKLLGLNRSTVTRLLYSLERAGFLRREEKTKEYSLTHWLFHIGSVYLNKTDLHKEAMTLISDLSEMCRETVHLAILRDLQIFYLDKVEGPEAIRMASGTGIVAPAYCTGVGKALLAYLPKDELDLYIKKIPRKRYTQKTICNSEELKAHLAYIRKVGYAIDDCEHEKDVRCVAAPVWDSSSRVVAAISLSGPAFRMVSEKIENSFIPAVKDTAEKISRRLGYLDED